MIKKFQVDLITVHTRDDLFRIFALVFSFPDYFGKNWDAFFDVMYSLDSEILGIQEISHSISGVHLILLNFDIFQNNFSQNDLNQFCNILVELSANKKYRGDHLAFTFELLYSPGYGVSYIPQ